MTVHSNSLIGVGLYTIPEASRLTKVSTGKVRRWLYGHTRTKNGQIIKDEPLWYSQIDIADEKNISFRDLMEVKVLNKFHKAGVSIQYLRKIAKMAKNELNVAYPFSSKKFETDGKKLYDMWQEDDDLAKEMNATEPLSKQNNFIEIIEQSFIDIEFKDYDPILWWPAWPDKYIIVDPRRSFGQPVDNKSGVPTAILYEAVGANKSHDEEADEIAFKEVARDFNVAFESVKQSYDFECGLAT